MKIQDLFPEIKRVCTYSPELNNITGSINATLFLCQLIYWHGKQTDTNGWIYKTRDEVFDELGMSRREQETARRNLKQKNIIQEKRKGVPPKVYIKINFDVLAELWSQLTQNVPNRCTKCTNLTTTPKTSDKENISNGMNETVQLGGNVPNINTEITSKNKEYLFNKSTIKKMQGSENDPAVSETVKYFYDKLKKMGIEKTDNWYKKEIGLAKILLKKFPIEDIKGVIDWALADSWWAGSFNSLGVFEKAQQRMKGDAVSGRTNGNQGTSGNSSGARCDEPGYYDEPEFEELLKRQREKFGL